MKVSNHTFIMAPISNPVKYRSALWLSKLVRKYGVFLDRSRATARGVTRTKKWSHIWDHSTKAVKEIDLVTDGSWGFCAVFSISSTWINL